MNLDFKEWLLHVNAPEHNHYQQSINPEIETDYLCVCGPISQEIEPLYNMVLNNIPNGDILEIGNWLGASTITLALGLKERYKISKYRIYTIDIHSKEHSIISDNLKAWFDDCPFDMSEQFLKNIKKWEVDEYIEYHRCFSDDFDVEVKDVAMLWIDGDHTPSQVQKDLRKFVPMLMKDGLLVMHDRSLVINLYNEYNEQNDNILYSIPEQEIDHQNRMVIARKVR